MARRSRSSRSGGKAAGAKAARSARSAAPRRKAEQTDVEVVEESVGLGIDGGIAIATLVVLLVAILFLDCYSGSSLGGGVFF